MKSRSTCQRIVIDLHKEGQSDTYVTDLESRVPRRLTNNPSEAKQRK